MAVMLLLVVLIVSGTADAFTLKVVTPVRDATTQVVTGYTPIEVGFRWLLEEDNTENIKPGIPVVNPASVQIHNSYASVARSGESGDATASIAASSQKRYLVSVLPKSGYTQSGAMVKAGQDSVTVIVNPFPVPTAQISVFVFNDNNPINNAPDIGESGLPGFSVLLFDQLGQVSKDAFNNNLGTEYVRTCDATGQNPGSGANFCLDADGAPVIETLGTGVLTTDDTGFVYIKYINPGKYGVRAAPPLGTAWVQNNTIEGTPGIDAWVKADEPTLLIEFGPAFTHIFLGFVNLSTDPANPDALPWTRLLPGLPPLPVFVQPDPPPVPPLPDPGPSDYSTITGRMIYNHIDGPPGAAANAGLPVPECYVALNDTVAANEAGKIAAACNPDGTFTFNNVPPGTYQLVSWDKPLDYIFNFTTVIAPWTGADINLGDVIMQPWFGNLVGSVFFDENENGFRDTDEIGIPDQAVNLRFRDGSIYQGTATDPNGNYSLNEVFPFFRWLVAEVDYARHKATGSTSVIDAGGPLFDPATGLPTGNAALVYPPTGTTYASMGITPQIQLDGSPYTTDTGVVLTKGLFIFAGMTNLIDWGKKNYTGADKGDLSGIVYYATTRAENDPQMAAADPWEPGIARVQVNLYADDDGDGKIDDRNGNNRVNLADVDNDPQGNFPGPEDIDRNANGVFDFGDAVNVAWTDNWDDNKPTGCIQALPVIHGQQPQPCFDGFFTWNQVKDEVFNGGYAFGSIFPAGPKGPELSPIPTGQYIVEAVPPRGYEIVKEEDRNVDFGDVPVPSPQLLPPPCVGELHSVPSFLDLFPDVEVDPAFAGTMRPLCDRKLVNIEPGQNSAADFFMFTKTPKAARAVGMITNDVAAAFAPTDPSFGEKAAPSWLPISFRDWAGNELVRTYSDEFGGYNALLPSTFTVNAPIPTGVSPHMITICLNHPGPIPDPNNPNIKIVDPFFNSNFSQTCYTFDFWPAKTTYLDTPVLPLSAFASGIGVVDLQPAAGTPVIASVEGRQGAAITCADNEVITLRSMGTQRVPNPAYDPTVLNSSPLITRDFGFGNKRGTVTLNGTELTIVSWSSGVIKARVPLSLQPGGELLVTRGDNGLTTRIGVNLHVDAGGCASGIVRVSKNPGPGEYATIQEGIDAAPAGALVLVEPGLYIENPVIWKNVRLQGAGAGQTIINSDPSRTRQWKDYVTNIVNATPGVLLPGQDLLTVTQIDSTPGILVLVPEGVFSQLNPGLIDGFTVRGATNGGAILVNGYAHYMEISNNKIANSLGAQSGGIRIGFLGANGHNNDVYIHHNEVVSNSSFNEAGGIAIFDGSDNYRITDNVIAGNVGRNGGGILHQGLSNGGVIARNKIAFNEVFSDQLLKGNGGGIFITGGTVQVGTDPVTGLPILVGSGAGNITIDANVIQGNLAGAGQGGGIRALTVNFKDLQDFPGAPANWYALNILNNMIVNNVAADAGGAIALKQAARVNIINNTIANNDSVATALVTFPAGVGGVVNRAESTPQPAGIVGTANSQAYSELSGQLFPDPVLVDNIIWQNRSFFWRNRPDLGDTIPGLFPAPQHSSPTFANATYWDLEVITAPDALVQAPADLNALQLNPTNCILTSLTGPIGPTGDDFTGNGNFVADPKFVKPYFNELVTGQSADEAGNNINVFYRPLSLTSGDYHIVNTSPAVDAGVAVAGFPALATDIDGHVRPNPDTGIVDIGADELVTLSELVTLIRPNGGEVIPAGSTFEITWTAPETPEFTLNATQFDLFFSPNNGATWVKINNRITSPALNANGKVPGRNAVWTVPTPFGNKPKCLIRVVGYNDAGVRVGADRSNLPFTTEVVHLDSPNGGAVWTSGTTQKAIWTASKNTRKPVDKVRLLITLDGGATWKRLVTDFVPTSATVESQTADSITYSLPVDVQTVTRSKPRCLIRVLLLGAGGAVLGSDKSDGFFTILPNPVQ